MHLIKIIPSETGISADRARINPLVANGTGGNRSNPEDIAMTNVIPKKILLCCVLILITTTAWAGKVLYVQSANAKMMSLPAFSSNVIEQLSRGTTLDVIETSGRWTKVKHADKIGWVPQLLLSENPPMKLHSLLQGREDALEHKARRRASSSATAAATRGLRNDERNRMSDSERTDYKALQKVDSVTVKDDDVKKFEQEGLSQP